jgi:hypothetical protein
MTTRPMFKYAISYRDRRLRSILPLLFRLQSIEKKSPAEILDIFTSILGDPKEGMTKDEKERLEAYCRKWNIKFSEE